MTYPARRSVVGLSCVGVLVSAISLLAQGGQTRPAAGVYADVQATRGGQIYQAQCLACHGAALDGAVGPPLAGETFLAAWSARSLADLVDKIEKTMPPQQAGSVSQAQAIDLAAFFLRSSKWPAGPTELGPDALARIVFPGAGTAAVPGAPAASFAAAGNLAQLMRAVTFPNANILFNVQVKDPGTSKPAVPVPFDYVLWGSTVYYGWQAVDQAALALIETTPAGRPPSIAPTGGSTPRRWSTPAAPPTRPHSRGASTRSSRSPSN
jgi:mono/diheme cytochrome c family protein